MRFRGKDVHVFKNDFELKRRVYSYCNFTSKNGIGAALGYISDLAPLLGGLEQI